MWRFPMLAPYCKVDDIVLFTPRRRVATAFAGVFVSMLALLPFAAIWALAPQGGLVHDIAGSILLSARSPPRSTWCRSCGWTATTCSATR